MEHQKIYLSRKRIDKMTPDELLEAKKQIEDEIEDRGIGMLFG